MELAETAEGPGWNLRTALGKLIDCRSLGRTSLLGNANRSRRGLLRAFLPVRWYTHEHLIGSSQLLIRGVASRETVAARCFFTNQFAALMLADSGPAA